MSKVAIPKHELETLYLGQKKSIIKLSSYFGVCPGTVYNRLKEYKIPIIREELISRSNRGKPKSQEHRRKLAEAHIGKKLSEKHKKKLSLALKGRHWKKVPNKEEMYHLYWERGVSANQIAKMYNVDPSTILFWMKRYGIKVRSISEAHKGLLKGHWAGDKNPSKRPEVRAKISKAAKERWKKQSYREKMLKFLRQRFKGKNHPMYGKTVPEERKKLISQRVKEFFEKNPDVIKVIKKARREQKIPKHHTKPELKFIKICRKYSLPFKYVGDGRFWIGSINPDFVHNNGKKIAVEIFGDYWHSGDSVPFQRTEYGRRLILQRYGWKLIVIWEHELKELDFEKTVLEKIGGT